MHAGGEAAPRACHRPGASACAQCMVARCATPPACRAPGAALTQPPAVGLPPLCQPQFKALTRLTVKPLVETLPCLGGVTVSLLEVCGARGASGRPAARGCRSLRCQHRRGRGGHRLHRLVPAAWVAKRCQPRPLPPPPAPALRLRRLCSTPTPPHTCLPLSGAAPLSPCRPPPSTWTCGCATRQTSWPCQASPCWCSRVRRRRRRRRAAVASKQRLPVHPLRGAAWRCAPRAVQPGACGCRRQAGTVWRTLGQLV